MDIPNESTTESTTTSLHQDFTLFFLVSFLSLFRAFRSLAVKLLLQVWFRPSSRQKDIYNEVYVLNKELATISMVDEFAKHAKLQRKISKLTAELETLEKDRNWRHLKVSWSLRMGIRVLYTIVVIIVNYNYRYTPILMLPKDLLQPYYPLGYILAFPHGIEGKVAFKRLSRMKLIK